jgi:hypothetical protein
MGFKIRGFCETTFLFGLGWIDFKVAYLKAETFLPKTGRALKHSFACGMKKMSIT